MGGFGEIVELTVLWAKPSKKARSFQNTNCVRIVKRAKQCLQEYYNNSNEYTKEALRLAEREKVSTLNRAKTLDFRQGVYKASKTPAGVQKLAKQGRESSILLKELPQFPFLRDNTSRSIVSTFEGKVKILRETFFPPPIAANLSDIATTSYPLPITTNQEIKKEEVAKAIRRPAPDKVPGISGIPNRFLRVVLPNLGGYITHLFQACWNLGYHPRKFKEANTIVLKKLKKDDYSEPKSYRPIALLDTLGKAFETVVATRLSDCAEENRLLPPEQMRARRRRSIETALGVLIQAIYEVQNYNRNNVASLLSLDVARAFDNISHERLLYILRKKGVLERIVKQVASFLTDRATLITLGRRTSPVEATKTGILQGSPVSLVLFLFFNSLLIEAYSRAKLLVQVGGFVDDVHLLAYSKSTEANCDVLGKAHKLYLEQVRIYRASFAPYKYKLVHLARRLRKVNIVMLINFRNTIIELQTSIRILGLQINTKLKWGPHLVKVSSKIAIQGLVLKCLTGSIQGAIFQKARVVYSIVIRLILTFAAPVWYSLGNTSESTKKYVQKLTVVQNDYLRTVLGAYRAIPVPVLEVEAVILPIQLQLDKIVMNSAALKEIHPVIIEGKRKIRKSLKGKRGRVRRLNLTPIDENEVQALRSLEVKSQNEAS